MVIQANATLSYWWYVNICPGNDLVPSGKDPLPEPMVTQIYVAVWAYNEFRQWLSQ